MARSELPLPPHFDPGKTGQIWKIPYQERADEARAWAREHGISPAADDDYRICLVAVDVQNTFCLPGFELYVGGRSGTGAVDDNRRLCEFIYRHLPRITRICPTMDTHQLMQIFHPIFLVDGQGNHPPPFTLVSEKDLKDGRWKFNSCLSKSLGVTPQYGQDHLLSYARKLREGGKYDLTIWPYHAMLGGIGHALVAAVEEAVFFHGVARCSQPIFEAKGKNPLTEHYSVLGPEVLQGPGQEPIGRRNTELIDLLLRFDAVIIAGQAKSHCVAWTISDLLEDIRLKDERLTRKVYLLEDCTSPVVIPGVVDYTGQAEAAFKRFADAGMNVVRSIDPLDRWPGIADVGS
jgi:nicotinamidase-related amidase